MRKYLLSLVLTFSVFSLFSQELKVKSDIGNPSNILNDGFIDLQVSGGTPPYTYKWNNPATSLKSERAVGLVEGVPYTVIITDSQGNSTTRSYTVKAQAITEIFNGTFKPMVDKMGAILFWDPFAAVGIYDPVVYTDSRNVPTPGWTADVNDKFTLKSWKVKEGSQVKKGELLAVIQSANGQEVNAYANTGGTLEYLVKEGGVIYNSENKEDVIEVGAHNFAKIKYDQPIPLTYPNGDPQIKNIPFIVVWLVLGALFFTLRMGFINFRGFRHAIQLAKGKYDDPTAPGEVTHFQALATAVSGTVGLGNIAGVAVAISLGGQELLYG